MEELAKQKIDKLSEEYRKKLKTSSSNFNPR